jgi:transposase-like protein
MCPCCGSCNIMEFADVKRNRCKDCTKDFSIRVGTIFENSNVSLKKWFMASYLFNAHKKGISSTQLAKDIGVSQPTAWFMLQRLRYATGSINTPAEVSTYEVDEVYIGGKLKNMHMNKRITLKEKDNKACVVGIVNRETKKIKTTHVINATASALQEQIHSTVGAGSIVVTDESRAYHSLPSSIYNHKTVNHSQGEYVKNVEFENRNLGRVAFKVHTNTVEGCWGLLKRGINGIYHWVSKKHLQQYCNEFAHRYNTRDLKDYERFTEFLGNIQGRLTYKVLVA